MNDAKEDAVLSKADQWELDDEGSGSDQDDNLVAVSDSARDTSDGSGAAVDKELRHVEDSLSQDAIYNAKVDALFTSYEVYHNPYSNMIHLRVAACFELKLVGGHPLLAHYDQIFRAPAHLYPRCNPALMICWTESQAKNKLRVPRI